LLVCPDLLTALDEVLAATVEITGAEMGGVQLFRAPDNVLELVAQRGFGPDFLDRFRTVGLDDDTACGRAVREGRRVVIEDVDTDPRYGPYREAARLAGFRSVQSTPLSGRSGELLGTLSTHYRRPHRPSERELRVLDLHCRQAADVIERVRAEGRLRESEERFRLMVQTVQDHAIFLMDQVGHVASWNEGAQRILGYAAEEILGQPGSLFFAEEDRRAGMFERELKTAAEAGRATDENWQVRKDGGRFWASGTTTALRDEAGKLRGFAKIFRDLTDRKRLEEELRDASRRKDEFLATLAHELRNPLTPLRGVTEALRRQQFEGPALDRAYAMMDRQVEHLIRLVDDLLDVSRITRGLVGLRKEPVSLADVVGQAVEMANPAIQGRGHDLTLTLPREPLSVEGDRVRLTQVVFNLLHNAAKYTDPGGKVWLTAGREGGQAVVRVRDSGQGMASDLVPKVFDLFTQAERPPDRSQGGLGLGLTLVRRLVEMHGGTVEARSEGPGKGSEFIIRLPQMRAEPAEAPQPPRQPLAPAAAALVDRVLVVDDNREVAESLVMLLQGLARDVRMVHSGQEALDVAKEYHPNVIVCDLGMPGMDGYEVARRARREPGLANTLLAAVSGYGQDEHRRRSKEAGFDRHLVKPIGWATLEELLKGAAGRK
jgi:PAS domain S-box-containing protein